MLNQIGCAPDLVIPADVNEARLIGESPRELVTRLAFLKGEKIFRDHKKAVIVAADTTVALGRRVVGKPRDAAEAEAFLTMLSGRNPAMLAGRSPVVEGARSWMSHRRATGRNTRG